MAQMGRKQHVGRGEAEKCGGETGEEREVR